MIPASKKPVWIALAFALIFHTVVISLQASRRVDTSFMRIWLVDLLAPAEKLVDSGLNTLSDAWEGYFALIGVQRENERLRSELGALRLQNEKQSEEILEAGRLRALLSLREIVSGRTVAARVIGRDTAQAQTVTIDKGRSHGVQPDSAVITPEGVVGRVLSAGNFFSIVQLIVDSQSGVGVLVRSNRLQGIVRGMGTNELDLDYIDDDNEIMVGDELITSGLDRIYPKGLFVGAITSIGPRVGLMKTVRIRPAADLDALEEVLCIVDPPETVDIMEPLHRPQAGSPAR
jgi:rod shape-determining protein MreC